MSTAEVTVEAIVTGEVPMPRTYVFRPPGSRLRGVARTLRAGGDVLCAPCLAYVIRHPEAGTILVDTGFHRRVSSDLRGDFGRGMSLVFRGLRPAAAPYDEQLRALGVEPDEVERVVMTHLHVDHTSGMRLLPAAEFTCSRAEWAAAAGRLAAASGFVASHLPPAGRMRLVDLDAGGEPHGPFERTLDLLGDGSVRLLSTPGHTPGHLSVLLRAAGGRDVLLAGDAVYTLESLRGERLPLFTAGDERYLRSLRELKAFADTHPDAVVVPSHDPEAWRRLRAAPVPA